MKSLTAVFVAALMTCLVGCSSLDDDAARAVEHCLSAPAPSERNEPSQKELLVAAWTNNEHWALDRRRALDIIAGSCWHPGQALEVRPITANSMAEAAVFKGHAPSLEDLPSFNSAMTLKALREAYIREAIDAVDKLSLFPQVTRSDLIGAIKVGADALSELPPSVERTLVAVHHGWPEGPPENLYAFHGDPRTHLSKFIAKLQSAGEMPDLDGVTVYMVGLARSPAAMETSSQNLEELCGFWKLFYDAAHAQLRAEACTGDLPSALMGGAGVATR